jgi:hypothetical protein
MLDRPRSSQQRFRICHTFSIRVSSFTNPTELINEKVSPSDWPNDFVVFANDVGDHHISDRSCIVFFLSQLSGFVEIEVGKLLGGLSVEDNFLNPRTSIDDCLDTKVEFVINVTVFRTATTAKDPSTILRLVQN